MRWRAHRTDRHCGENETQASEGSYCRRHADNGRAFRPGAGIEGERRCAPSRHEWQGVNGGCVQYPSKRDRGEDDQHKRKGNHGWLETT